MKHQQIILIFIIIFLILAIFVFRLLPLMRHPQAGQSTVSTTTKTTILVPTKNLPAVPSLPTGTSTPVVQSPLADSLVTSPLAIHGQAPSNWFFEAVFPVELQDANGKILARTQAHAQSDWTTGKPVWFVAKLEFKAGTVMDGKLVLRNDNPSGLPENAKSVVVPVRFK